MRELTVKGLTRSVAFYVHKSLNFSRLDTNKIGGIKADAHKEVFSYRTETSEK